MERHISVINRYTQPIDLLLIHATVLGILLCGTFGLSVACAFPDAAFGTDPLESPTADNQAPTDSPPTGSDGPKPAAADKRFPVPTDAEQIQAMRLLKDLYGKAYEQARTSAARDELARTLFQTVEKAATPAETFAVLRLSRDVAAAAGSAELAFQAIDTMAQHFQIDARDMKLKALDQSAARVNTTDQRLVVVRCARILQEECVLVNAFEDALRVGQLAMETAKLELAPPLIKEILARNRQIEALANDYATAIAAFAILEKNPKDPAASLTAGKYLCFANGDWQRGLPMLANSSDSVLKELAVKDVAGATSAERQIELGDGWWAQADANAGGNKRRMMERAVFWYSKALPSTVGLMKERLESRLAELPAVPSRDVAPPGDEQPWIDLLSGVDFKRDVLQGQWTRVGNGIKVTQKGELRARVRMKFEPNADYVLRSHFLPISGELAGPTFEIPVGASHKATVIVQRHNFVLARIFGNGKDNAIVLIQDLKIGEPHVVELHVTSTAHDAEIRVLLDGNQVLAWKGPIKQLVEDSVEPVLEAFRGTIVFETLEYRAIPK